MTLFFAAFALPAFALPSLAWAQEGSEKLEESSNQAAAQALFDEGMRLLSAGSYAESCKKFEASLGLVSAMGTRGKLAECYEKVGRTASAWATYREVAVLAQRASQFERVRVAKERATRLEAILSYLTIEVGALANLPGLRIVRDGALLGAGAYGTAIASDPGELTLQVHADGYQSKTVHVTLGRQERRSIEIPVLVRSVESLPSKNLVSKTPPEPKEVASPLWRKVAISSVAAGGGALLVGAVLGIKSKRDYDEVFDDGSCDTANRCTDAGLSAVGDARFLANVGTVFAVTGAVLVGVGAYLWLRPPSVNKERSLVAVPSLGPDSATLTLLGRF